jgi:uncharacterized protein (DUF302 family)
MNYYFSTNIETTFEEAYRRTVDALKVQGFGVLTEIDMQATMKKKLDADIKPYKILGACNPEFAYKALQKENKIGTMLPCNVIIQETDSGKVEVSAVDPVVSMQGINNPALIEVADTVRQKLKSVLDNL